MINFHSPEWQTLKLELDRELQLAIQNLLKAGSTEAEYNQWRGRAALANKLLAIETGRKLVTDKGE